MVGSAAIWPLQVRSSGATTTEITITRHDAHGNITATQTVNYQWMESNLPVVGDGVTHYYLNEWVHNANTWDQIWDPSETYTDPAVLLDMGTPKGTDLRDLCDLVGATPGDKIAVTATDSFNAEFDYENIYHPEPRQGKIIAAWWNGVQGGYVPDYAKGLRLQFMAETTNAAGKHIFGLWDMHETMPPAYWGYTSHPETGNISVSNVCNIDVYEPNLVSCDSAGNTKENFAPGETVYVKGSGLNSNRSYKLWIQPDPVTNFSLNGLDLFTGTTYSLSSVKDPSNTQETVITDSNGDFSARSIWSNCVLSAPNHFDIVADDQAVGLPGYYDGWDYADSPGLAGFSVASSLPMSDFTARATTGSSPFTVHFVDQSVGPRPLNYAWDFDGSPGVDSTDHNPVFTYTAPGTYSVALTVTDYGNNSHTKTLTNYITVTEPQAPVADFTTDLTTGTTPITIHFSDLSTYSPTSWAWDFNGDGIADSEDQNPSYTYTSEGTYSVTLTATNDLGSDSEVKMGYIVVAGPSSQPAWDLNNDHVCNIGDVVKVGLKWGLTESPGWIPEDMNRDGTINIGDVVYLGLHWGETW